jgi:phage shock protein C
MSTENPLCSTCGNFKKDCTCGVTLKNINMEKLLRRSRTSKWIAGICGGLGKFFGIDPALWRLIFALGALFSAVMPFLFIYIIMWFVIPREEETINTL